MIDLIDLSKTHSIHGERKVVADRITARFESGESVALLGRNGAGKSSLLRMIAGTMEPDAGEVASDGTISWPVGFAGSFHGELTGAQNIRFIARVYGIDTDELVEFVAEFAEIGPHFDLPVRSYSAGMRARLAFGLSMGIRFDTYLVDENTAVGDAAFREKSKRYFTDRMQSGSAIVVSHSMGLLREICTSGCVLEDGQLYAHATLEDAIAHHQENMKRDVPHER